VVFLFDLTSFQVQARHYQALPPPSLASSLGALEVAEFPHQDARGRAPSDDRGVDGARLMVWARDQGSALNNATAAFLRFDACPGVEYSEGVNPAPVMMSAAHSLLAPFDPQLSTVVGCEAPKLRLTARLPTAGGRWRVSQSIAPRGTVKVEAFAPDEIVIRVEVSGSASAWLVYADADHPDWRASVNGTPVSIKAAYGAFKAVQVPPGPSTVKFVFRPGILRLRGWLLGASAAALAALLLAGFVATLLRWTPRRGVSRS
jgi:hypothetical protein